MFSRPRRASTAICASVAIALTAAACGSGGGVAASSGSGTPQQSVAIGVTAPTSPVQWWTTLANSFGYFKKENLSASQPVFKGGVVGVQAVISGSLPFTQGLLDVVVKAQAEHQDLVMVAVFSEAPIWDWIVSSKYRSQITSIADLRGHNVGVTTIGSGSDVWTRVLLAKHGLTPGRNVGIVSVGVGPSMVAAMSAGDVVGGVQVEPFVSQAVASGQAYVLASADTPANMRALTGHSQYPSMGLLTTRSYIQAHPNLVQRTVNAYVDTLMWLHSHTVAQIVSRIPNVTAQNRALWTAVVAHVQAGFSPNGLVTESQAADVVRFMSSTGQLKKVSGPINPAQLYDMSFVKKAIAQAQSAGL